VPAPGIEPGPKASPRDLDPTLSKMVTSPKLIQLRSYRHKYYPSLKSVNPVGGASAARRRRDE